MRVVESFKSESVFNSSWVEVDKQVDERWKIVDKDSVSIADIWNR